ncbi:hypothetical protein KAH81_10460 [bacterium]|nr:hypothetical protein [bacterium]
MSVRIVPVDKKGELKDFIKFPWFIYRKYWPDYNWVPPLKKDMKFKLDTEKHPFWKHAERELFLAYDGLRLVGRIGAIIDHNYNELWDEKMGAFGFFECINDQEVANALFDAAANWLKDKGMTFIRGPLSPSMNDECAFLVEGFDKPPTVMMPYNPKYYPELAEGAGFAKAKDLLAFYKNAETGIPERLQKLAEALKNKPNVKIRKINFKDMHNEMVIIKDLYNKSWEKNWGFSPMTDEEMDLMGKELKPIAVPELALLVFVNGKPAGIGVTIPNYNQVLKHLDGKLGPIQIAKALWYRRKINGVRAMVFGFKPQFRRTGLPILLYLETEQAGRRLGYKWCELSWNLEDNDPINKFDSEIGGEVYKRYRIYEREI